MTYHKKAARLIRDVAVRLELLALKAQDQMDHGDRTPAKTEELEERRDGIEEAICDLLTAAENLERLE